MSDKKDYTVQIAIAIIGLIGTLGAAAIANWDRMFPQPTPQPISRKDHTEQTAQTTDGWAIIGKARQGDFFDLKLEVNGNTPAIGRTYKATMDFRLVQKRLKIGGAQEQVITLGMVHRGDSVEVLDLYVPTPSSKTVFVWAKLRAVLHPISK